MIQSLKIYNKVLVLLNIIIERKFYNHIGRRRKDLAPRKHIIGNHNESEFHQLTVLLHSLPCLSAIKDAILLHTSFAVAPITPAV